MKLHIHHEDTGASLCGLIDGASNVTLTNDGYRLAISFDGQEHPIDFSEESLCKLCVRSIKASILVIETEKIKRALFSCP